jgi:hypothetical protein
MSEFNDVDPWFTPLGLAVCFTMGFACGLIAVILVAIWIGA